MRAIASALLSLLIITLANTVTVAQTTEFTYQGNLLSASDPATGNYDFEFVLYDSPAGGVQQGSVISRNMVAVMKGTFSVILDFGNQYPGAVRYLEVRVRPTGGAEFTILSPRQQVTSAPYAVTSKTSENALKLGDVAASQYVLTDDGRLSDPRAPLPGSPNYIQNGTSLQAASDFNINGTGKAGIFDAASQFKIGGERVFATVTNFNTFAGVESGTSNGGQSNSFFGYASGRFNTTGSFNSFLGVNAGANTTFGNQNSFFGYSAGAFSTTGSDNAFVGYFAGNSNGGGSRNTFVGANAGLGTTNGASITLIGNRSNAILFGTSLLNATAIGANAMVAQNNSLVLGSINGVNNATADTNVGIGTTTPASKLHVNNGSIRVTNGGVYITNPNTLIITSPNGSCWGLTVSDGGAVSAFPVNPCP